MEKFIPLYDRVYIERNEAPGMDGGLIIPDAVKEKVCKGKVIAVGLGKFDDSGKRIPVDVKEGDVVSFEAYAGNDVLMEGKEYLVMPADMILGIIKNE